MMRFGKVLTAVAATALVTAPTMAAAANPAAPLSVSKSVRASANGKNSNLGGGMAGWAPVALLAVVAIVGIVVLKDNGNDGPNSP